MRGVKEAIALIGKGYDVHLITNKLSQFTDWFRSITLWPSQEHLYAAIRNHSDADLFHVHNEPSYMVTAVKEIFPDKPVVLDVHDSILLRRTDSDVEKAENDNIFRYHIDERNNIQLADGLVYVCEPMRKIVQEVYKVTCPQIILPSYVPEMFYGLGFGKWFGGLVYDGRIDVTEKLHDQVNFFSYCDYRELATKCKELEVAFYVYTPQKQGAILKEYNDICNLMEPQRYDKLIEVVGSHDWGLVGNTVVHEEWKHALPNKLFEYIAGCVPVVVVNADESARFVSEHGIGIVVDSLEELRDRWKEHRDIRKKIVKIRREFTLENHIGELERLYEGVGI